MANNWCKGTYIFDDIMEYLIEDDQFERKNVIKIVIKVLENHGWNCQNESQYFDESDVIDAFEELTEEGD